LPVRPTILPPQGGLGRLSKTVPFRYWLDRHIGAFAARLGASPICAAQLSAHYRHAERAFGKEAIQHLRARKRRAFSKTRRDVCGQNIIARSNIEGDVICSAAA